MISRNGEEWIASARFTVVEMSIRKLAGFCIVFYSAAHLCAQGRLGSSVESSTQAQEIVASAGSYTLQWRHHYERQTGLVLNGVSDDSGTLYVLMPMRV